MMSSTFDECSMASRITVPAISSHGVVMIRASALCSFIISTAVRSLSSAADCVRLRTTVPHASIWFRKNSPKFLIYILAFVTSTTVVALLSSISTVSAAF